MREVKFRADLIEGHKGVIAVVVPFEPELAWGLQPVRLAGRRHGWPVEGRIGRRKFAGYIGDRWADLVAALKANVGDALSFALAPSRDPDVLARAVEQSRATTQPKKARADAEAAWEVS
jgi:hypothetical protein